MLGSYRIGRYSSLWNDNDKLLKIKRRAISARLCLVAGAGLEPATFGL